MLKSVNGFQLYLSPYLPLSTNVERGTKGGEVDFQKADAFPPQADLPMAETPHPLLPFDVLHQRKISATQVLKMLRMSLLRFLIFIHIVPNLRQMVTGSRIFEIKNPPKDETYLTPFLQK